MRAPALIAGMLAATAAWADMTLVMVEAPGCAYCARWHADIGPAYPKTEEGRRAPLRRVDISEGWPDDLSHVRPDRLTPTFILLDDGVEVGRLRGYAGDQFFWPLLGEMLDAADAARGSDG